MATLIKEFHTSLSPQRVDSINGVIHGVAIITSGVKARGHDLEVDLKTLEQIKECACKMGTVPVKWNHRTGADAVNGYLDNFRIEETKLLGDWHLLKSHDRYAHAIEMAERMPSNVGLSAAFMGEDEMMEGKKFARASEVISVDLVANPAANPDGLFSAIFDDTKELASVDIASQGRMDNNNTEQTASPEPSLQDVMAMLQGISERIEAQDQTIASLQETVSQEESQEDNEITLDEIMSLSEQDIAALLQAGEITEEDAAGISAYQAEVHASLENEQGEDESSEGAGELAGVGAGSEGGSEGTALSALQNQVRELSARFEREDAAAENNEIAHYFSTIEGNMNQLAAERAQLMEFSDKLTAENDALRSALKTGTRPLAFSAEGAAISGKGGELHEFESRVQSHKGQGKTHAQAVMLAHKENPAAHQDWIRNQA
jgi:hypothetical protein